MLQYSILQSLFEIITEASQLIDCLASRLRKDHSFSTKKRGGVKNFSFSENSTYTLDEWSRMISVILSTNESLDEWSRMISVILSTNESLLTVDGHKWHIRYINPMSLFYSPWKCQKAFGFLTFSGGMETEHWTKMG